MNPHRKRQLDLQASYRAEQRRKQQRAAVIGFWIAAFFFVFLFLVMALI